MKVLDAAHHYLLESGQEIQFIKKEKRAIQPVTDGPDQHEGGSVVVTTVKGTTNEEVLEVLLDRTRALNALFPCQENVLAIAHMDAALAAFNSRTAARQQQGVEGTLANHS